MNTGLRDGHGRSIDYLRLSLTDRCDLRCSYCMPKGFREFETRADWLTAGEIRRVVAAFIGLGARRVRLTGGEPLTRRDVVEIAESIGSLSGLEDLSLTTNATQLARHATALRRAGVSRLNVSLDSLDRERFSRITGKDALPAVLDGLRIAGDCGFAPIKLNMVVLAGVNEHEAEAMAEFCAGAGFVLRLIEVMPVGDSGRQAPAVSLDVIRRRLQDRFGLVDGVVPGGGPARYLVSADRRHRIGFITPMSRHFCDTCNRVRLSAEGKLMLCLGQEDSLDLRALLREGADDGELAAAIGDAIRRKPARHDFNATPGKIVRIMAQTGG